MTWMVAVFIAIFAISLWLIIEGAEKFTDGLLEASAAFGISSFTLGFLFNGFDPDNLAVGIAGATQGLPGISMGTAIGAAVFLLTFAAGITAILWPLRVDIPRRLIIVTLFSPLPMAALGLDGVLSRSDGTVMLIVSLALIGYVVRTTRWHPLFKPDEKQIEEVVGARERPRWWAPAVMIGGTIAIVIGAALFNWSVRGILRALDWDETMFGMIIVAAAVSVEEIFRMFVPARQGRAEVVIGNIMGTILFFVLFNVGVIALIHPLPLERSVLGFYWPFMMAALVAISIFLWRRRIGRTAGGLLMGGYVIYLGLAVGGGYQLTG
jgi:cation:H+ antiporter